MVLETCRELRGRHNEIFGQETSDRWMDLSKLCRVLGNPRLGFRTINVSPPQILCFTPFSFVSWITSFRLGCPVVESCLQRLNLCVLKETSKVIKKNEVMLEGLKDKEKCKWHCEFKLQVLHAPQWIYLLYTIVVRLTEQRGDAVYCFLALYSWYKWSNTWHIQCEECYHFTLKMKNKNKNTIPIPPFLWKLNKSGLVPKWQECPQNPLFSSLFYLFQGQSAARNVSLQVVFHISWNILFG